METQNKALIVIDLIVRWAAAAFLLILAKGAGSQNEIISALLIITSIVVILPLMDKTFNNKKFKLWMRYLVAVILFLLSLFAFDLDYSSVAKTNKTTSVPRSVTITFLDEGEVLTEAVTLEGELIEKPEDPIKEGYIFSHWATHQTSIDGSEVFDFDVPVMRGNTIFSHYKIKVPDFSKIDKKKALELYGDNEQFDISSDYSNKIVKNKLIKQSEIAGEIVNEETTIVVTYSLGKKPTLSQENALRKAKDYISIMPFSHSGLIKQLEFEKYSYEDAKYGADNCGANWNEQAHKKAKDYLDIMPFSRGGLIDQLLFEGFTQKQAVYGVNKVGL